MLASHHSSELLTQAQAFSLFSWSTQMRIHQPHQPHSGNQKNISDRSQLRTADQCLHRWYLLSHFVASLGKVGKLASHKKASLKTPTKWWSLKVPQILNLDWLDVGLFSKVPFLYSICHFEKKTHKCIHPLPDRSEWNPRVKWELGMPCFKYLLVSSKWPILSIHLM